MATTWAHSSKDIATPPTLGHPIWVGREEWGEHRDDIMGEHTDVGKEWSSSARHEQEVVQKAVDLIQQLGPHKCHRNEQFEAFAGRLARFEIRLQDLEAHRDSVTVDEGVQVAEATPEALWLESNKNTLAKFAGQHVAIFAEKGIVAAGRNFVRVYDLVKKKNLLGCVLFYHVPSPGQ